MYRNISVLASLALVAGGLAACASLFGGEDVRVRAVENISSLTREPRDPVYESAVSAINARDYARALDYLQEARAKDPRDIKALNALGVVYDKLGRFDLSARYYDQAHMVDPNSRIVAKNVGYSRVLEGLLNPGQRTASVTIGLPADLNTSSPEQPTVVISATPVVVATGALPAENLAAAASAISTVGTPAARGPEKIEVSNSAGAAVPFVKSPAGQLAIVASTIPAVAIPTSWKERTAVVPHQPAIGMPPRSIAPILAASRKVLTIGQPVKILNAAGKRERVQVITHRLGVLGWTVRQSDMASVQPLTTLSYSPRNLFAANAMRRTLPFPIQLVPNAAGASVMQLVIGRDYLSWKSKNSRLNALWQKDTIMASLQKLSIRGVR